MCVYSRTRWRVTLWLIFFGFGEIDAGGTSTPTTSLLQAPILSGITGLTARPIETLGRVPVKSAALYAAFH